MSALLAQVKALVTLAADERTPLHERENAALAACRKIHENGLLDGLSHRAGKNHPESDVWDDIPRVPRPIVLAIYLLCVDENGRVYRFSLIDENTCIMGSTKHLVIPKPEVISVDWMPIEESRPRFKAKGRVARNITVTRRWWDEASAGERR